MGVLMRSYLGLIKKTLNKGVLVKNRTGIPTFNLPAAMFTHDMQEGFPLLTTKKMAFKSIKVELEGFIKGKTKKSWYQERGCRIWDEWCSPKIYPNNYESLSNAEQKDVMKAGNELGEVYGAQWRNFNGEVDQLKNVIDEIKKGDGICNRRLVVSAWNPLVMDNMALPPCHVLFQLTVANDFLNLTWYQRSCDLMIGIPFNIASYGLLLHLIAKETGLLEGQLTGMLNNVHIYENHQTGAILQIRREPLKLPELSTNGDGGIFEWDYTKTELLHYWSDKPIKFDIAV